MKPLVRASLISTAAFSVIWTSVSITPLAQAAPSAQPAPTTMADGEVVAVTSSNSVDVTGTAAGDAELAEFASRHSGTFRTAGARSLTALQINYKVLQIEMGEIYAAAGTSPESCDVQSETLVAPETATNITYRVNTEKSLSPDVDSDACQFNVEWDEETTDQATQDDPVEAAAARPYAQKYASACFSRKWRGYNHQIIQVVHPPAVLDWLDMMEDVSIVFSHCLIFCHEWCPSGSHASSVCLTELAGQFRNVGHSSPKGFAETAEVLKLAPLELAGNLTRNLARVSVTSSKSST